MGQAQHQHNGTKHDAAPMRSSGISWGMLCLRKSGSEAFRGYTFGVSQVLSDVCHGTSAPTLARCNFPLMRTENKGKGRRGGVESEELDA